MNYHDRTDSPRPPRNGVLLVIALAVAVIAMVIVSTAHSATRGRKALASWYGPGLYGNRLGCGGRLYPRTFGVAHKGLRCGARVTVCYHGRCVRVPVVDRGPYVGGREFDLTAATARAIGFSGVHYITVR